MEKHIKALGILNIVLGSLGAVCGMLILFVVGGPHNAIEAVSGHPYPDSGAWPLDARIGLSIAMLVLLLSVPSIIGGIGLLGFAPWAKILTIVISAFQLFNVPVGTALGIYGLWVLCSPESQRCFISTKNLICLKFYP
jgi:hypothetical protein